ncbi:hypothetical protein B1757_13635 [Acidithiobacillus marinus]|uniref:Lipoprotein n=1 Tax=Acidithiobacillus marinus TaxID=187490 RepID=A0A2I1DIE5_9PROT|nr:hypothetical protein [Acidithiobacillus marinus]PKY09640.1 hypothetical protein B1757_13635 [Acidithiobacillus marinus]
MDKKLVKITAKIALLAGAFGLAGCASAYIPDTVHNHYKAPASMTKVPGAENVAVTVIVHNHKKRHDEISRTKDELNIPFAGVYMHIDKAFKAAIEKALASRGFSIGGTGTQVQVVVQHFYLPEEMGWHITHKGHLAMQVTVPVAGYRENINIQNFHHNTAVSLGAGRTASANALLTAGVNKLVDNPQFIAALLKAGHSGAVVPRLPAG